MRKNWPQNWPIGQKFFKTFIRSFTDEDGFMKKNVKNLLKTGIF